ncbi:hypothetical protein LK07_32440 [Streptomyces pluripotens]|uniref:Uncharacterized protein n=1 Tax=Streptomyces pluripotens TaxID=1355015 RepID=A0A221P9H3_9ACTN|nr:DUF6083 domain-containing protein [Streptomyces pluripotens]ARP74578.1 hypothetical protein LK06_031240 [Streptomyces pluripotens]ASN28857.1 hypothetical protein LK07_32440 [Streptomyces pluripotens]
MGVHDDSIIPLPGPDGVRQPAAGTPRPWENTDRAQAAVDGATGPEPPGPPRCPHCGLAGERRPTYTDRHVLLEPGLVLPAHLVPGGHRWHLDGNGVAWNGGFAEPPPGTSCRVPHLLACPGLTLDEIRPWRWLSAVRGENARKVRRQAAGGSHPDVLPDAG